MQGRDAAPRVLRFGDAAGLSLKGGIKNDRSLVRTRRCPGQASADMM